MLSALERTFRGQGPGPWSRQTASIPCFPQNTNGWNSYFSNVNFPLQHCHLQRRPRRERGRERKRGYILYHFLFFHTVSFWPCSWYASVLLSILLTGTFIPDSVSPSACLTHWCSLYLSACLPLSALPVHPWPAAGSRGGAQRAGVGMLAPSRPPIRARRQMPPLPLHPFLTTRSRGSVFCCSWMALSKSLFVRPVCLSCMSDENSDPFFPTRSASSGIIAGPSAPLHMHARTHTHTHTISFSRQGRGAKRRDTVYLWKQTGRVLWRAQFRLWIHTNRKGERQVNVNVHYISIDCWASDVCSPGFLKALLWPKSRSF